MKVDLVVFDIAGTTVTDNDNVNEAFSGAFKKAGFYFDPAEINRVMGYRKIEAIKLLFERFYPDQAENEPLIQQIHENFTEDMKAYYQAADDLRALPYAEEMFRLLHQNNIRVALNTGFTKAITDAITGRLGWDKNGLVDCVISSDEVPQGRPYPFMIESIMEKVNVSDAKNVVKVGDTEVDIAEGRNAGCGSVISVTTGSYSREELEKYSPDHIIGSLQELPAILNLQA